MRNGHSGSRRPATPASPAALPAQLAALAGAPSRSTLEATLVGSFRLHGVAALEPLLTLFQRDRRAGGEGEARRARLLAALVSLGVPDERIFYLVAEAFRRDPILGAERFEGLRMSEALHVLCAWIGAQHPALATDPRRLCDEFDAVATAIVGLGGTLTVDQAAKHARLRAICDDRAAATRRLRKDNGRGERLLPFPTGDDVPAAGLDDDAEGEDGPDAQDPEPPGG